MLPKVNRIVPRSQRLRNLKRPNLLNGYTCNYKSCITYVIGCYSCQWEEKELEKPEDGSCCYSWREILFFPFLVASFGLSLIFLFVWVEASNEYFDFDWAIFLNSGIWFFWSLVLLSAAVIVTVYTTLLLVFACILVREGYELYLHWSHKILVLLVVILCTFLLAVLCTFWRDKWLTFGLSLKVFAPYMHLSCIIVMIMLAWPVAMHLTHLEQEARLRSSRMTAQERKELERCNTITKLKALQVAFGLPFILILLFLYLIPLGIYSPCILEKEKLGPKPAFFGHRGAPMDGPENTMMSFEKAVEQGAFGLESDIYLSVDHVPFLMHDHDLRRTTDIHEILPEASLNHSAFFRWDFLTLLNAGKWFLEPRRRPYFIMKYLSEADKDKARKQKIPKLSNLLELAKKEKKFVIFDLQRPPPKHPLRNSYVRKVVKVILDSQIEQNLIYWLPHFDRAYVKKTAPGFQQVGRLFSIESLKQEKIKIINVDYKELFYSGLKEYKAANITINLYTINEPWLYSMAWCASVHSVTTNNIHLLNQLNRPYFFMTPSYYMILWLVIDIISAISIFSIFNYHWWKQRRRESVLKSTGMQPDNESLDLPQNRTEGQGSPSASQQSYTRVEERPWTLAALFAPKTYKTKHSGSRKIVNPKRRESRSPGTNLQETPEPSDQTSKKQPLTRVKSPRKPAYQEQENVKPPVFTTSSRPGQPETVSVP